VEVTRFWKKYKEQWKDIDEFFNAGALSGICVYLGIFLSWVE